MIHSFLVDELSERIDLVDEASRPLNVWRRSDSLCICISAYLYLRAYVAGFKDWYALDARRLRAKQGTTRDGRVSARRRTKEQNRWPTCHHHDETKRNLSLAYTTSGAGV